MKNDETVNRESGFLKNGFLNTRHDRATLEGALEYQIEDFKASAETWMKTAAVVGGIVLIGYSVFRLVVGGDEADDEEASENEPQALRANAANMAGQSTVARMIMDAMAMFLISIAKQKLKQYLASIQEEDEQTESIVIENESNHSTTD